MTSLAIVLFGTLVVGTSDLQRAASLTADSVAFVMGSCGSISNNDLRYFCNNSCGSISDNDMRYYCNKSCGSISNNDLRYFCNGSCGSISNNDMRYYCGNDRPWPFP